MNVDVAQLPAGVFGVSKGGGLAGDLIRRATESSAGHAFLYLGGGKIVSGEPPRAVVKPADAYPDAIWAHRMWDQLAASGWDEAKVTAAQAKVTARGQELVGCPYDWAAYAAFTEMVLRLRTSEQLAPRFEHDPARVCSGLVADALKAGGVPLDFVPGDGPGLLFNPLLHVDMPPNLVAPGMLLGLGLRHDWM